MGTISRVRIALLACVALSACSANRKAIHMIDDLPQTGGTVITVDAKQRAIETSFVPFKADGTPDPTAVRRFCSEPSPDVYSVLAQSLSVGGSFGQAADPASIQAAFNGAFSSAEQGTTIPRTQTINMLRELMFRTCERFLSGGYDAGELSIQAIRDQRLMVSILAIEQLTGAVTPRPVVIGAAGSATSGAGSDAIARLDDARKAKESAETSFAGASNAYASLNGDAKICDTLKGKKDTDTGLSDADKANIKPCDDARSKRDAAKGDLDAKTAAYLELANLARTSGISAMTTTSYSAPGGIDAVSPQGIENVALAVREIVALNFSDGSEVMMFCLKYLPAAAVSDATKDNLRLMCIDYLKAKVQAEQSRLLADTARLHAETVASERSIERGNKDHFAAFWLANRAVFATQATRTKFVTRLRKMLLPRDKPLADCFASRSEEDDVGACFATLDQAVQRELLK